MKKRLDVLLVERGFLPSREKAKAVIMAGQVYVNGQKEDKAGTAFDEKADIQVRGPVQRYVSRGGLKLEKAMQTFPIRLEGKVCMDVGASTGGFTDCMLQNGAVLVYSVDVGRGQLAWSLREDPRVVCLEKTNIRYLTKEQLEQKVSSSGKDRPESASGDTSGNTFFSGERIPMPSFVSIDVSFISLALVLPAVRELLTDEGEIVSLIKPQFEAGKEKVGRKGVVRDKSVHEEVISKVVALSQGLHLKTKGLTWSPVKGPEGNIEYLLWMEKRPETETCAESPFDIHEVVTEAHAILDR